MARTTTWIAGVVAAAVAVLLPAGYFALSYQHVGVTLETQSEVVAAALSQYVNTHPQNWDLEMVRLESILTTHRYASEHMAGQRQRVVDARGVQVVALGRPTLRWPVMTHSAPVLDAGVPVGRLEVSESLTPLLFRTALAALLGVLLSGAVFVTLRVLPIRALRRSQDRLQAVAASSTDAIILVDDGGGIVGWNPAAHDMFGYTEPGVMGRALATLVADQDREAFERLWTSRSGAHLRGVAELTGLRSDQREFPVELSLSTWRQGSATYACSIVRDVSERKRAERLLRQRDEELQEARRLEAVGRLAGGVAHELNNLLTVIGGRASLIRSRLAPADALREEVERIERVVERARQLVQQLLGFGRRQIRRPRVLDLGQAVGALLPAVQRLLGPQVEAMVVPGDRSLPVALDPAQLEQVLAHLATNARDAMPGGGKLAIGLEEVAGPGTGEWPASLAPGRYAVLTVTDSGQGMSAETRTHLFEPFFTTKDVGKGSGLGLAAVHGIVKQNGGEVTVESEPGQGATFRIYLPLTGEGESTPPREGPSR